VREFNNRKKFALFLIKHYNNSMNTVMVNKKIKSELRNASIFLGLKEQDIFKRALTYYLYSIKNKIALKKEMEAWDALSDEAFHLRRN